MKQGHFFRRKEIWVPTWKSCLLGLVLATAILVGVISSLPAFLGPHRPIKAEVLAVEGWVSDWTFEKVVRLAKENHYALVAVTGEPIEKGMNISAYGNYAMLGAERLRALGFTGTNLVAVPSPKTDKDRTYQCGAGLARFLRANTNYRTVNLISAGVHARRSWLLFRLACAPDIQVGVIEDEDPTFDKSRWWKTSHGVRSVIDESIGYIYAKFIFQPPATPQP